MSEWVSVNDRLPAPGEHVLTRVPKLARGVDINHISERTRCWVSEIYDITHWMPIPTLPPPPEPQLTVKEVLAEAVAYFELHGGPIAHRPAAVSLLPRLRAALEAEQ